jgi:hypothetical protein
MSNYYTVGTDKGELIVESKYDSGKHQGFIVRMIDPIDEYRLKTADEFLTSEEINAIEVALLVLVTNFINKKS